MRGSSDFYFDSMSQIHMPYWSKERIALVGDAAYSATPLSRQGTSLAIVGAYVLAVLLTVFGSIDWDRFSLEGLFVILKIKH
ncbi:MAG: hypothetical protein V4489_06135 [Chlamydiota bacterium]